MSENVLGRSSFGIPLNCGTRPVAIPHGLAGSTGRDFDGRFWKSIINIKIYKSPNEKSRPVGGAHGFGPFGLIQKIPPGQFWIFDHIILFNRLRAFRPASLTLQHCNTFFFVCLLLVTCLSLAAVCCLLLRRICQIRRIS